MGLETEISWCHTTANLWWGCTEASPGCDFCYARSYDAFRGGVMAHWGSDAPRMAIKGVWANFTKAQKLAEAEGQDRRTFVGSMMDIFEKSMPLVDRAGERLELSTGDLRERYFREVVPNTPNLLHLMLTKRPSNIERMLPPHWLVSPQPNVMFGYSAVNQDTAEHIRHLIRVPGRHFLSMEPLLGLTDLTLYREVEGYEVKTDTLRGVESIDGQGHLPVGHVDWVIVGGESGPNARPMHPIWAQWVRDQCQAANVPFHFKQWGEWIPKSQVADLVDGRWVIRPEWVEIINTTKEWGALKLDGSYSRFTSTWNGRQLEPGDDYEVTVFRVGKHNAGRLLDGVTHDDAPGVLR